MAGKGLQACSMTDACLPAPYQGHCHWSRALLHGASRLPAAAVLLHVPCLVCCSRYMAHCPAIRYLDKLKHVQQQGRLLTAQASRQACHLLAPKPAAQLLSLPSLLQVSHSVAAEYIPECYRPLKRYCSAPPAALLLAHTLAALLRSLPPVCSRPLAAEPRPWLLQTCHGAAPPSFLQPALCLHPPRCCSACPGCAADLPRRYPLHQPNHPRRCPGSSIQRNRRHSRDSPRGCRWQWRQQWQACPWQWCQQWAGCPWAGPDPRQE